MSASPHETDYIMLDADGNVKRLRPALWYNPIGSGVDIGVLDGVK
jgi:hypothetical protein